MAVGRGERKLWSGEKQESMISELTDKGKS